RLEHAQHGAQGVFLVGDVAQAEGDGDHVEVVVREGQLFGVGLDERNVAGHALVQQTVTTDLEHGVVDVGQHHLAGRPDQAGEFACQVTSAAGDIQHAIARAHA